MRTVTEVDFSGFRRGGKLKNLTQDAGGFKYLVAPTDKAREARQASKGAKALQQADLLLSFAGNYHF